MLVRLGRTAAACFCYLSVAACAGGTLQLGSGSGYTRIEPARRDLVLVRPGVACDRFTGQCFATRAGTASAFDAFHGGPFGSFGGPSSARRYVRTERDVVCDQRTAICYKDGRIDQSETRDAFGRNAARRADGIRDGFPGADVFVPRGGIVCDEDDQVCYKRGRPDRSETRDYFGKSAARRL